jgi:hypothetical protein
MFGEPFAAACTCAANAGDVKSSGVGVSLHDCAVLFATFGVQVDAWLFHVVTGRNDAVLYRSTRDAVHDAEWINVALNVAAVTVALANPDVENMNIDR